MPSASSPQQWYRIAHIAIFLTAIPVLYWVVAELLRAVGVVNPVTWIAGRGVDPDDHVYELTPWKPLDRATVSDAHDAWVSSWGENTQIVREFRKRHNLSDLVLDETPMGRRVPIILAPQFDDNMYPKDPSRTHHESDMYGLIFGKWKSTDKSAKSPQSAEDLRDIKSRIDALEKHHHPAS